MRTCYGCGEPARFCYRGAWWCLGCVGRFRDERLVLLRPLLRRRFVLKAVA